VDQRQSTWYDKCNIRHRPRLAAEHLSSASSAYSCSAWAPLPFLQLALPSQSPLRPPHLCGMKCYTHPRQCSKPCSEKPPTLHICRTSNIDAREPRIPPHKADTCPIRITPVGVETPPNIDQRSNKLNIGCILLNSPDPLAYIPLRREGGQKRWAWGYHVHVYIHSMFSHSRNCVCLHNNAFPQVNIHSTSRSRARLLSTRTLLIRQPSILSPLSSPHSSISACYLPPSCLWNTYHLALPGLVYTMPSACSAVVLCLRSC
jgi:hypothetical protein